jgi:GTP pyrophosphokinase
MTQDRVEPAELTKIWKENPDVIRRFLAERPQYEQLCAEVAYILEKRLTEAEIEVSTVIYRAKTLKSFAEKITRKSYRDPFEEITDLAGVRIVYLYRSDFEKIEAIIKAEFSVIERVDKIADQGVDRFGYGAIHYLVRLGRKSSGARYDDLKDLLCEIQVRTVLQDAWAIIDHHLIYKRESDMPTIIRRKINSLAGVFETADYHFDAIRSERETYVSQVKNKVSNETEFLRQEINLDTVRAFLESRFPELSVDYGGEGHISMVLKDIDEARYKSLQDLDSVLRKTSEARKRIRQIKDVYVPSAAGELAWAIALDDPKYRESGWSSKDIAAIKKFETLVQKEAP